MPSLSNNNKKPNTRARNITFRIDDEVGHMKLDADRSSSLTVVDRGSKVDQTTRGADLLATVTTGTDDSQREVTGEFDESFGKRKRKSRPQSQRRKAARAKTCTEGAERGSRTAAERGGAQEEMVGGREPLQTSPAPQNVSKNIPKRRQKEKREPSEAQMDPKMDSIIPSPPPKGESENEIPENVPKFNKYPFRPLTAPNQFFSPQPQPLHKVPPKCPKSDPNVPKCPKNGSLDVPKMGCSGGLEGDECPFRTNDEQQRLFYSFPSFEDLCLSPPTHSQTHTLPSVITQLMEFVDELPMPYQDKGQSIVTEMLNSLNVMGVDLSSVQSALFRNKKELLCSSEGYLAVSEALSESGGNEMGHFRGSGVTITSQPQPHILSEGPIANNYTYSRSAYDSSPTVPEMSPYTAHVYTEAAMGNYSSLQDLLSECNNPSLTNVTRWTESEMDVMTDSCLNVTFHQPQNVTHVPHIDPLASFEENVPNDPTQFSNTSQKCILLKNVLQNTSQTPQNVPNTSQPSLRQDSISHSISHHISSVSASELSSSINASINALSESLFDSLTVQPLKFWATESQFDDHLGELGELGDTPLSTPPPERGEEIENEAQMESCMGSFESVLESVGGEEGGYIPSQPQKMSQMSQLAVPLSSSAPPSRPSSSDWSECSPSKSFYNRIYSRSGVPDGSSSLSRRSMTVRSAHRSISPVSSVHPPPPTNGVGLGAGADISMSMSMLKLDLQGRGPTKKSILSMSAPYRRRNSSPPNLHQYMSPILRSPISVGLKFSSPTSFGGGGGCVSGGANSEGFMSPQCSYYFESMSSPASNTISKYDC